MGAYGEQALPPLEVSRWFSYPSPVVPPPPTLPMCCVYIFHSLNLRLACYLCSPHYLHPNQGQLTWMHRRQLDFFEHAIPEEVSRRQMRNPFELGSTEFVS